MKAIAKKEFGDLTLKIQPSLGASGKPVHWHVCIHGGPVIDSATDRGQAIRRAITTLFAAVEFLQEQERES